MKRHRFVSPSKCFCLVPFHRAISFPPVHLSPYRHLASNVVLPIRSPLSDKDPSPGSLDPKPFCDSLLVSLKDQTHFSQSRSLPLFVVWSLPLPYLNLSHLRLVSHIDKICRSHRCIQEFDLGKKLDLLVCSSR